MFKREFAIIFVGVALLLTTSYFFFGRDSNIAPEDLNANEESINVGGVELLVDIADEPAEQMQGLSGRDKMAENKGMLFIFARPITPGFWMKDMNFALDMIWINENGAIIGITKNISPETYPKLFYPPSAVTSVIEVNAGWSDRNNIKVGDSVQF